MPKSNDIRIDKPTTQLRSGYKRQQLVENQGWAKIIEEYIRDEDSKRLTILLQEFPDLKLLEQCTVEKAETCLHMACRHQHLEIVRLILGMLPAGMIDSQTKEGLTPLHYVAKYSLPGRLTNPSSTAMPSESGLDEMREEAYKIAHLLIKNGASMKTKDEHGMLPLHYAALRDSTAVTHALLNCYGIGIINETDVNGMTPLLTACAHGSVRVLRLLLKKKASVYSFDKLGNSVLHLAAELGDVNVLNTLWEEEPNTINTILRWLQQPRSSDGSWIITEDFKSKTALHLAVENNHLDFAKRMLYLVKESSDGDVLELSRNDQEIPITAAKRGFLEVLKNLHSFGFPLTVSNEAGETPLHVAASSNHHDTVKYLLDTIEDDDILERKDGKGMTPLLRAACGRNQEAAKFLLRKGANFEVQDNQGRSLVYLAAENNNHTFLKEILEALIDESPDEIVEKTEEPNCNLSEQKINARKLINSASWLGWTGLHVAASKGYLKICELLKGHGASIDELNLAKETPLHLAAKNGHLSIVKFCLNWFKELTDDKTLINVKMRRSSVPDEERWLKCFIKAKDNMGNTALHLAAENGHTEVCKTLLKNEAEVNIVNFHKRTPLDLACEFGHLDCVKMLVDYGSDVNGIKFLSKYPLLLASKKKQYKVVEYLLARPNIVIDPIDTDEGEREPMNALEMALEGGQGEMARALLGHKDWKKLMQSSKTIDRSNSKIGPLKKDEPDQKGLKSQPVERKTPMRTMINKYPDLALKVMDQCIVNTNMCPKNPCANRTYHFEFIEDTFMIPSTKNPNVLMMVNELGEKWYKQRSVRKEAQPYDKNPDVIYREHPLMLMDRSIDADDNPLLEHDLVKALLAQKWNNLGRYVYFLTIIAYLMFLLSFTVFLSVIPPGYTVRLKTNQSMTLWEAMDLNSLNKTHDQWIELCGKQVDTFYTKDIKMLKWLIIILATLHLIMELVQMYCRRLAYISIENSIELFIYISSLVIVYDFSLCTSINGVRESWQWQLACISAFLAWINLLLFLRKLPKLGIFILMFSNVLRTFLRFAIIFILFNLAFSITFFLLMQNRAEFSTIPRSVLKSLAMQIGELDYSAMFYGDDPIDPSKKVETEWLAYPLFLVFCIVMTILLMNLLVGMAVDNINDVQKKAEIRRIRMNMELVLEIERSLPILKRYCIKSTHEESPNDEKGAFSKMMTNFLGAAGLCNFAKKLVWKEEDDIKKIKTELIEQRKLLRELQESLIGFKRSFEGFASEKQRID